MACMGNVNATAVVCNALYILFSIMHWNCFLQDYIIYNHLLNAYLIFVILRVRVQYIKSNFRMFQIALPKTIFIWFYLRLVFFVIVYVSFSTCSYGLYFLHVHVLFVVIYFENREKKTNKTLWTKYKVIPNILIPTGLYFKTK